MNSIAWMTTHLQAPARHECRRSYNPRPSGSMCIGGSAWIVLRLLLAYHDSALTYRSIRRMTGLDKAAADYAVLQLVETGLAEPTGSGKPCDRKRYSVTMELEAHRHG